MTTEVLIEEADLDDGRAMIYKDFGTRIRLAFDPHRITEALALRLLVLYVPRLDGALKATHCAGA